MKSIVIAALTAAAFTQAARAEATAPQADAWTRWAEDFSREMRASMGTMFSHRVLSHHVVKGAPYSARVLTETNQALADGNVISHKHEGAVYRDGEGRMRQETAAEGKRASVVIDDPVERKHYILMPDFKRAIEMPVRTREPRAHSKQVVKVDGREIRVEDGKVFVDGKEATDTVAVKSRSGKEIRVENGRVTVDGKEVSDLHGTGTTVIVNRDGEREEVRVRVVRAGDDLDIPMAPLPPMPPVPPVPPAGIAPPAPPTPPVPPIPGVGTLRFESTARLGKGVTTSLGTKDFDGVKAEGKQTVWTIPAGEIGNRNPINVTSESWYSPELQVTVYSRYDDPRTGESVYRLAGIKRGEPAADLFKVPAGYEVKSRAR